MHKQRCRQIAHILVAAVEKHGLGTLTNVADSFILVVA
jgi:hypothetical protein